MAMKDEREFLRLANLRIRRCSPRNSMSPITAGAEERSLANKRSVGNARVSGIASEGRRSVNRNVTYRKRVNSESHFSERITLSRIEAPASYGIFPSQRVRF